MRLTSIIAIYTLFWVLSAFVSLSFGVRTHEEAGIERVPGQADSAPAHSRKRLVRVRPTLISLVLFGLYYANYVNGWIVPADLNLFGSPPNYDGSPAD